MRSERIRSVSEVKVLLTAPATCKATAYSIISPLASTGGNHDTWMEVLERFLLAPGNGGELGTVRTQTQKDKITSFQSISMNSHALYTCACKIQEVISTVFICSKVEGCSVVYS